MNFIKYLSIVALFATQAHAEQAPTVWTGYGGDAAHTGYIDIKTNPSKFKVLWSKRSSSLDWPHQLTASNQTLYSAFNVLNGDKKVAAFNPDTGDEIWERSFNNTSDINGVIYSNNKILVTVFDLGSYKANIIALDATKGNILFTMPTDPKSFSSNKMPAVVGNELYLTEYGNLASIDIDKGTQNWSVTAGRSEYYYGERNTPTVSNNYIFVIAEDGGVEIINKSDKTKVVIPPNEINMHADRVIWDAESKNLYVASTGKEHDQLTAYNPDTQAEKWKIVNDRILHVASAGKLVYYSTDPLGAENAVNAVYELNAATGKMTWSWNMPAEHAKCSRIEDIMVTKDLLFITIADWDHSDKMHTIAFSRKTREIVWELDKVGHLSADNKHLFLEGHDSITAIALN